MSEQSLLHCALIFPLLFVMSGCTTTTPEGIYGPTSLADGKASALYTQQSKAIPPDTFFAEQGRRANAFASHQQIEKMSGNVDGSYRMGAGDVFAFLVRGREDISLPEVIVSPDGWVNLPRVGHFKAEGQTIPEMTAELEKRLARFYQAPNVTLVMKRYENNKVYVLGRVANPGVVHLPGSGTLLEALSLAGGMPADTAKSFLSRCMIIRGKKLAIWIELKELLNNGDMRLNARLQNGDVIFIPQSEDQMAYVMGEVARPGTLLLRSDMTVLDAIMKMGGATDSGNLKRVFLVRTGEDRSYVEEIDVVSMMKTGDLRENFVLRDGDIVYLSPTKMGKFNYYLKQLAPSLEVVNFAVDTAESFGLMQELRKELWGQEGFVGGE
jgi:polysaccharide export outer membrane protein